MWFFSDMQMYYMTICIPLDPNEEFLLTDSSYNVFEGPNCYGWDPQSKEVQGNVQPQPALLCPHLTKAHDCSKIPRFP